MITQVCADKVRIVEQNVIHHKLPRGQQWTRELPMHVKDGYYTLSDTFPDTHILGWMIQTIDDEYAWTEPAVNPALMTLHAAGWMKKRISPENGWMSPIRWKKPILKPITATI